MDAINPVAVVAMAQRKMQIYDLKKPNQAMNSFESPLKFQSRVVTIFPDKRGYALGSIEGRCAIRYFDSNRQRDCFAFKCHRDNRQNVYAVNAISFSTYNTISTQYGSFIWDTDNRSRLWEGKRLNQSITATSFSSDNAIFAYASSYD